MADGGKRSALESVQEHDCGPPYFAFSPVMYPTVGEFDQLIRGLQASIESSVRRS